jgi:SAM-dependent methyltransferase
MPEYVLDHHMEGERARLALMSRLLDPLHRRLIEALELEPGARIVEVGVGNGSMSAWLAERASAVAVDLDLSLVQSPPPNLELRQTDILSGPVPPGDFDLVTARAVLHHVADADRALANLVASVRPGGAILLIEPDFLPVSVSEPEPVRRFWSGWLAWSQARGIDYFIGRTLAPRLQRLGIEQLAGEGVTAVYNGGSPWAEYWTRTVVELRSDLDIDSEAVDAVLRHCEDPSWWTETITFTCVWGRAPGGASPAPDAP